MEKNEQNSKMAIYLNNLPAELREKAKNALSVKNILNIQPPKGWINKHPIGGFEYISIDKIEMLLDTLFKKWEVTVMSYNVIANSVAVHIRLRVETYDNEVITHDGLGAAPIHTEKGASPVDHTKILTDSVMKALPAAKSFAIKDAAEHLGEIFGRNIGRKNVMNITGNIVNDLLNEIKKINI